MRDGFVARNTGVSAQGPRPARGHGTGLFWGFHNGICAFDRGPDKWQTTRPSETGLNAGNNTLVKAELGTKRVCPQCAARFYDLEKRPIECPKCEFSFEPESLYKQRRPRTPEPAAPAPVRDATDDEDEDENEDEEVSENEAEEAEEKIVEAPLKTGGDDDDDEEEEETVEEEAAEAGMSVVDADAADIEDIEDSDDDEEEDDGLLEEEEDEDDVSGIIDADIEKDER
ncbi:MAG TPA: FYDLN acid domain-containing protein [Rhizomicrobium sp.]|nr:FYDLN acid domain-containing protein [Rhizomicrobium sp.]